MSSVTFQQVLKRYGAHTALDRFDLQVREREFLSLLGPSGCGKTTALRLVAGFIELTSGLITIAGRNVSRVPPQKRDIGMVFQDYALFPHLTVAENIAFGLREHGERGDSVRKRVGQLLDLVRLTGMDGRYPAELSGGQQQRVALARALAFRPRVLLMDEPLGALDMKLREAMQVELRQIQQELKITTIYVTHDQGEAMAMSDRIAVMNAGRIMQLATPEAIYNSPANAFVAQFVGKVNLLDAEVIGASGDSIALSVGHWRVCAPAHPGMGSGPEVTIAVRPEAIRLIPAECETTSGNALEGTVVRRSFAGNLIQLVVALDGGGRLAVETGPDNPLAAEASRVKAVWAVEKTIILPRRGEETT